MGHGQISEGIAHSLRVPLSFCVYHEVPQASFAWGYSKAGKGSDSRDLRIRGCGDSERECEQGPRASDGKCAAAGIAEPNHESGEGEEQPPFGKGISYVAKGVLGTASVGERILRVFDGQRDGRSDQGVHRAAREAAAR